MKNWSGLTHQHMLGLMVRLPTDFEPYGQRDRESDWGADCSCGCKWFAAIEGRLGYDWGVCANPSSPRVGLLTFEHQGCKEYEDNPELLARVEALRAESRNDPKRAEFMRRVEELRQRGELNEPLS